MGEVDLSLPCPSCGRPAGDHLVSEMAACSPVPPPWDLPYEDAPEGVTLNLGDRRVVVADNVTARACVAQAGPLTMPMLVLTFETSAGAAPGVGPLRVVSEVAVLGGPDVLRRIGKLVRDTANAAANRAGPRPPPQRHR